MFVRICVYLLVVTTAAAAAADEDQYHQHQNHTCKYTQLTNRASFTIAQYTANFSSVWESNICSQTIFKAWPTFVLSLNLKLCHHIMSALKLCPTTFLSHSINVCVVNFIIMSGPAGRAWKISELPLPVKSISSAYQWRWRTLQMRRCPSQTGRAAWTAVWKPHRWTDPQNPVPRPCSPSLRPTYRNTDHCHTTELWARSKNL